MAYLIANPDGTSNAKPGDTVVTGGGIYKKMADGTSKLIDKLPTPSGKTTSYSELQKIYNSIAFGVGGAATSTTKKASTSQSSGSSGSVFSSAANFDSFQNSFFQDPGYGDYNYSYSGGSDLSGVGKVAGYVIVGLVLVAILDRVMMGGKR